MAKQENLHENQFLDKRQQSTQELAMLTGREQTDKEACLSSQRHSVASGPPSMNAVGILLFPFRIS